MPERGSTSACSRAGTCVLFTPQGSGVLDPSKGYPCLPSVLKYAGG